MFLSRSMYYDAYLFGRQWFRAHAPFVELELNFLPVHVIIDHDPAALAHGARFTKTHSF